MNAILQFQLKHSGNRYVLGLTSVVLLFIGWFCGYKFNLTAGEGIYLNSPYTIGFMMALLSLSMIFLGILFALEILFKEWHAKFDILLFSYSISLKTYLIGKFSGFTLKTFLSFLILIIGFVIGQNLRTGSEMQLGFSVWRYLYPFLIFGVLNCFFICSVLFMIAYTTRKKLLVVIAGLLLYVLYMVLLVFSNSPFMAGSIPQSIEAQQLSSLLDPFGTSAYFFEARDLSVTEKNQFIVPLNGFLTINRIVYMVLSMLFLAISYCFYGVNKATSKKELKPNQQKIKAAIVGLTKVKSPVLNFGFKSEINSIISFAKVDLIYLFKSVTIVAVSILLVFFVGMEMYSDIDKGIRLPNYYASSGLLATAISQSFHLLGAFVLVYFINDMYWRSSSANFYLIEDSAFFSKAKLKGHLMSLAVLIVFLTTLLIVLALAFQIGYGYTRMDWLAYFGVIMFNTIPLFLFGTLLLLINSIINSKYVALGVSILAVVVFTTPLIKMLLPYPLLHVFSGFKGVFSDLNGYGAYLSAFSNRLLFGICLLGLLWIFNSYLKSNQWTRIKSFIVIVFLGLSVFTGFNFMKGYAPKNEDAQLMEAVTYEKNYRHYQNITQPTITDVDTKIDLHPSENAYEIQGKYRLQNLSHEPIHKILLNFHADLKLKNATLQLQNGEISIDKHVSEIKLNKPLLTNNTATLEFNLSYKWYAVNGHQSFNAIVNDGSFMRISNYYPSLGYQPDKEIEDEQKREAYELGNPTTLKKLEAPEVFKNDFINLDMIVSTENNQTPMGIGNVVKTWTENDRAFTQYKADSIPFRFAVASAKYQKQSITHRNIEIEVLYHDKHFENVDRLLNNVVLSLDYCIDNFNAYPFEKISFVEVSSFTSGFAATAYPATIFMTENMIFHTNIDSDPNKDVINELAGHELAHIWWGNSQINPDEKEGASMLTETLAMYTEMMIYKKMYGTERMKERVRIHEQIYDSEKGLYGDPPLYKVPYGATHIAYSKGAMAMVELSELIGEDKVNEALKNFLMNNKYPKKPTSLDLLEEFYNVAPNEGAKSEIEKLFKTI
ncbi:M1 family aminopeptidase [Aestuariibaculum sp. YM273]|uniref:ABC transporter permease/M1 family aminopeptidase n=1 Tax=Aestuariibaculum sp. YM273 TaxID=3070659 RepID=UPI0027DC5A05|nr:M1 family aminopeptidase [Aestuariibaculum sp. YM273]WMI64782.1 M1 family aminopeptidase [Aestuariibaculum sp. YM273]